MGKTALIPIPINNNTYAENDGTITFTLKPDPADNPEYKVAPSPANSATVTVIDDESLPVISIMADSGGVGENANQASFKLTATGINCNNNFNDKRDTCRGWS